MANPESEKLSTKREVNWLYVVFVLQIYISCVCAVHIILYDARLLTTFFSISLVILGVLGVTAGSHRLWAHHSYRASTPLKVFLILCQTLTGHGSIYDWVRIHRLHHKYFRTELDPYNPQKGFLYSHFISSNLKLSPAQEKKLMEIDMTDLETDNLIMFQKRYYWVLFVIVTLLLPVNAPAEYWDESIVNSIFIVGWLRFGIIYQLCVMIHSGTTIFDLEADEKKAYESNLVFLIKKSHWLSYHYMTPWDYQTSEYGKYGTDCTSKFIRVCAALELAHDLKTVDSQTVRDALTMSVDESRPISDCLVILSNKIDGMTKEHYLNPSKYF